MLLETPARNRILRELEERFGIGVQLHSIDGDDPVVVRATVYGQGRTQEVEGQGPTEGAAWQDFFRAISQWTAAEANPALPWLIGGG
jgi:hypothetical protein